MQKFLFVLLIFVSSNLFSESWQERLMTKIENRHFPSWMLDQIAEDLAPFKETGITKEMVDTLASKDSSHLFWLARYEIKEGILKADIHESLKENLRHTIMMETFQNLLNIAKLPDLDFIVTLLDDAPPALNQPDPTTAPVFAFAKDCLQHKNVALIPDFDVLTGGQAQVKEAQEAALLYPWKIKMAVAFWRGATTGFPYFFTLQNYRFAPRCNLVLLSLKYPRLINARFTNLCQMDEELKDYLTRWGYSSSQFISVADHLKYKYQILIDGNSCAYSRAYWQLFSNSLILKQDSPNIQWYYRILQENVHYLPLEWNCEDLPEKVQWAKNHEVEVVQMIKNANQLAKENLMLEDLYLYIYLLLTEYAKLQRF